MSHDNTATTRIKDARHVSLRYYRPGMSQGSLIGPGSPNPTDTVWSYTVVGNVSAIRIMNFYEFGLEINFNIPYVQGTLGSPPTGHILSHTIPTYFKAEQGDILYFRMLTSMGAPAGMSVTELL